MRPAYDELYAYAMARPGVMLQHVVGVFGTQTATLEPKPIRTTPIDAAELT